MTTNREEVAEDQTHPRRDHHIWWLILLALAGIIVYATREKEAFPSASIDLKVSRQEATRTAVAIAEKLGYKHAPEGTLESGGADGGTQEAPVRKEPLQERGISRGTDLQKAEKKEHKALTSTTFYYDDDAKTFLEYEMGIGTANSLMRDKVPVWSWRTRMCREFEQEEMQIWQSTQGELVAFTHTIENDRALPSLSHDEAERLARDYIEKERGKSLSDYKLVQDSPSTRPHRKDYDFTFEDQKTDYKGAHMRIFASVSGNMLTRYNYYLYVPEEWERKFSTIRSYNQNYASVASLFYYLLACAAAFGFFWAVSTHNARWRFALMAGGFMALMQAAETVNDWPQYVDSYAIEGSYVAYVWKFAIRLLQSTVLGFITSACLFVAAEAVYRLAYPHKVAMEHFFSLKGLRSKEILKGLTVGYILFAVDLGWVVSYYLLGEKLHFWCPLGVDNYEILTSTLPFIAAINLGLKASVSEEFLYRVIGLTLAERLTRNFWLANLLQAAAWGFMHSTYPQQPAFSRGVELTIGGMLDGWILRRYGLLPCLVSHYLFDAFLDSKPLFSSPDLLTRISAILPVVPFLLLFLWGTFTARRHGFVDEKEVINGEMARAAAPPVEDHDPFIPEVLGRKARAVLLTITVVSCAAYPFIKYPAIFNSDNVTIGRAQAEEQAASIMDQRNVSIKARKVVSWLSSSYVNDQFQYVFEQLGLKRTIEIADKIASGFVWHVRYFKVMDPEEYEVELDEHGREYSFDITKMEDAPGARLDKETARSMAEAELKRLRPHYQPLLFDSISEVKRKNRTDYTVVWMVPQFKAGEANFKVSMRVIGNEVGGLYQYWEVPDKWQLERDKRGPKEEIANVLNIVMYVVFSLAALWWAYGLLKARAIRWRPALIVGSIFGIIALVEQLNDLPQLYSRYPTTLELPSFFLNEATSAIQSVMSSFALGAVLAAFAYGTFRIVMPRTRLSSILSLSLLPHAGGPDAPRRSAYWLDGISCAYAYVALTVSLSAGVSYLRAICSPEVSSDYLSASMLNMAFPSVDLLLDGIKQGIFQTIILGVVVGMYARYCPNVWVFLTVSLAYNIVSNLSLRHWQDMTISIVFGLIGHAILWFFIVKLCRRNFVAYFLMGFAAVIVKKMIPIIDHALPLATSTVVFAAALLAAPLVFLSFTYWSEREVR